MKSCSFESEDNLMDPYVQGRLLKDLLSDPPGAPDELDVATNSESACIPSELKARGGPSKSKALSKIKTAARKPTQNESRKPKQSDTAGKAGAKPKPAVSKSKEYPPSKAVPRSVFSGIFEASTDDAISDARFAAAPNVFGESYSETIPTLVGHPNVLKRRPSDQSSDGGSVTSPVARDEPPQVVWESAQPTKQDSRGSGWSSIGLSTKGVVLKREDRRSSSESTGCSANTAVPGGKSRVHAPKSQPKQSGVIQKQMTAVKASDAASVASCTSSKWAGGSEDLVTRLTQKLQLLESEVSESKARASKAERRLGIKEEELSELREKLKQKETANEKREKELVDMAGFVRSLQERMRTLQDQNRELLLEKTDSGSARTEKAATEPNRAGENASDADGECKADTKESVLAEKDVNSKSKEEVKRLKAEVSQLVQQLSEMEAFLADYGLTWVGSNSANSTLESNRRSFEALETEKDEKATQNEGHWEPALSWVSEANKEQGSSALVARALPRPSVPTWLAAHLKESDESALLTSKSQTLPSVNPSPQSSPLMNKADQGTAKQGEEHLCSSKQSVDGQDLDLAALKEAIDGLNALASDVGSTVVVSPGGREHRLQEPASIPLTVYANGLQLGTATEFRPFNASATRALLADILDGFFPYELKAAYPNGVALKLNDRTSERFTLPFEPFKGEKRVLVSRRNSREMEKEVSLEEEEGSRESVSKVSVEQKTKEQLSSGTGLQELKCSGAHLFRNGASHKDEECATTVQKSEPVSKDEFLERLPKRVIRGGKLIDVRTDIAQLLGAPKKSDGKEKERKNGERADVRRGASSTAKIARDSQQMVRLKVRNAGGCVWIVTLHVDATVGELYREVERLRLKAVGKAKDHMNVFTLSTTFPTTALLDRDAPLSMLGLQQNTVLCLKEGQ